MDPIEYELDAAGMIVKFGDVLGLGVLTTDALLTVGAFEEEPPPQPVKLRAIRAVQRSADAVICLLLCKAWVK